MLSEKLVFYRNGARLVRFSPSLPFSLFRFYVYHGVYVYITIYQWIRLSARVRGRSIRAYCAYVCCHSSPRASPSTPLFLFNTNLTYLPRVYALVPKLGLSRFCRSRPLDRSSIHVTTWSVPRDRLRHPAIGSPPLCLRSRYATCSFVLLRTRTLLHLAALPTFHPRLINAAHLESVAVAECGRCGRCTWDLLLFFWSTCHITV